MTEGPLDFTEDGVRDPMGVGALDGVVVGLLSPSPSSSSPLRTEPPAALFGVVLLVIAADRLATDPAITDLGVGGWSSSPAPASLPSVAEERPVKEGRGSRVMDSAPALPLRPPLDPTLTLPALLLKLMLEAASSDLLLLLLLRVAGVGSALAASCPVRRELAADTPDFADLATDAAGVPAGASDPLGDSTSPLVPDLVADTAVDLLVEDPAADLATDPVADLA